MPDNGDLERGPTAGPTRASGAGWVPVPDPTLLTTEAVERATEVFRREIQALQETIETRLAGSDQDRERIWGRLRELPELYEVAAEHLRAEVIALANHNREVINQRLDDLDKLAVVTSARIERIPADNAADAKALATDFKDSLHSEREYILSQIGGLRDVMDQRLSAMDIATKLLAGSVEKFPTDIDRAVGSNKEIMSGQINNVQAVALEKFSAIDSTFSSNALALTAALAAQEKAVAEQNRSNTLAISKSESSTKETIAANAAQAQTGLASLADTVADVKERLVRIESTGVGVQQATTETRAVHTEQRLSQNAIVSLIVAFVVVAGFVITLIVTFKKLGRLGGVPPPEGPFWSNWAKPPPPPPHGWLKTRWFTSIAAGAAVIVFGGAVWVWALGNSLPGVPLLAGSAHMASARPMVSRTAGSASPPDTAVPIIQPGSVIAGPAPSRGISHSAISLFPTPAPTPGKPVTGSVPSAALLPVNSGTPAPGTHADSGSAAMTTAPAPATPLTQAPATHAVPAPVTPDPPTPVATTPSAPADPPPPSAPADPPPPVVTTPPAPIVTTPAAPTGTTDPPAPAVTTPPASTPATTTAPAATTPASTPAQPSATRSGTLTPPSSQPATVQTP